MKRPPFLRRVFGGFVASLALAGLVTTGLVVSPAAAVGDTHSLTVTVRNITGTPLSSLKVFALPLADGELLSVEQDADGNYPTATPVAGKPGTYLFSALGDYEHTLLFRNATTTTFSQYLGGASDLARAELVTADQSELSVSLATNAVISGVVKRSTGSVVAKALVTAYRYTGTEWEYYSWARGDSYGKYKLIDIDPGSYRLKFGGANGEFPALYSGAASTFDSATAISVGVGTTTTVNATFPKGTGTISGTARVYYDGYEYYGSFPLAKAHAVAIPVTVSETYPYARTMDSSAAVYSGASTSTGSWSIKNLHPGTYVVKVYPYYYNQSAAFIGGSILEYAKIFTVTAGSSSTGNKSYSSWTEDGASLGLTVWSATGNPWPDAEVLLQSDLDPNYYFTGTTNASGNVVLGLDGVDRTIQAGHFTLIITTNGTYAPYREALTVHEGVNHRMISLYSASGAPGFVAMPSIAETALVVGTTYEVAAQPQRSTAHLSYQWARDGRPIYGADEASYTSRFGDIGSQLTVHVTSYKFGYPVDEADAAVSGLVVSNDTMPQLVTAPTITSDGEPHVGTTLHVHPGTWAVPGLSFEYEWMRDGVPFENFGDAYVVTLDDLDHEFTASVTASKASYLDATASTTSGLTPVFASAVTLRSGFTVTKSISGLPLGSTKYTAKPGLWTALAPSFTYEWLRAGLVLGTGVSYVEKPTTSQKTQPLEVRVSASAPGFGPGQAVAVARKASVALQATTSPTVTAPGGITPLGSASSAVAGETLTVSRGQWEHGLDDAGVLSFDYQWMRKVGSSSPTKISGATGSTFAPRIVDIGTKLSVKVTVHSSRWKDAYVTVAAGTVVAMSDLINATPAFELTGDVIPGQSVYSPSVAAWTSLGATVQYQWYGCALPTCTSASALSAFTKVAGATLSNWYIPTLYAGGRIYLRVTATKLGSLTTVVATSPVTVPAANQVIVVTPPSTGSNAGTKLGAWIYRTGSNYYPSVSVAREWQVCFADCTTLEAVWATATGQTGYNGFLPSAELWGTGESYLRLAETATKTGYLPLVAYSAPVPIIEGELSSVASSYAPVQTINSSSWEVANVGQVPSYTTLGIEWFVEGELRSTANTFTAPAEDAGKLIYVVRTFSGTGFATYAAVKRVRTGTPIVLTEESVSVTGDSFGQVLTLTDTIPWELPDTPYAAWTISYHWKMGTTFKGSNSSYTVEASDVGKVPSVGITAYSALYGTFTRSVYPGGTIQLGVALGLESPLTLDWDGELLPGTQVTSSALNYPVTGVTKAYKWQSSADGSTWTDIAGATSPNYTVALTDSLRQLRLVATASKSGHATVIHTSDAIGVLEGNVIRVLALPRLSGDAVVGQALTTTTGTWSEGAGITTQWLLNGRAIPGATKATYTPLAIYAGDELSVRVTGTQAGRLDVSAYSPALVIKPGAAPTTTTAPVITGTTTLTATPGVWTVSGLTFTFEWKRDDVIVGTSNTLVMELGTVKADYSLTVRATRYGYYPGEVTVG